MPAPRNMEDKKNTKKEKRENEREKERKIKGPCTQ